MKKVVHIINAMEIGGVEVGVLSLLKSKLSDGYSVITVKGCDEAIYDSLTENEKSRLYVCNGYFNALRMLINFKPQLVISSLWRAHFVSILYKLIAPMHKRVHFVHSGRFAHKVDEVITRLSIFAATHVFCDSKQTQRWLEKTLNYNKPFTLPMNISFTNHVKITEFLPLSFVFIGRFTHQKNIFKSLDFICELKKAGKQVSLDLYGRDDGSLADLKKYVIQLNISDVVTFHDSLLPTEIEMEMQKYNFYLQTSLVEGMAISVFQSIKNGLFPVVTPVGEIKNYTQDGLNACYIDTNNISQSTSKFLDVVASENIVNLKVGELINKLDYPQFDKLFFSTLQVIDLEI